MTRSFQLSCMLFSLFLCTSVHASEDSYISVPIGENAQHNDLPQRGMSQSQTLQKYGEPQKKMPATGNPPIEKWIYADFSVIFERQWVIHSVKHRPEL